MSDIVLSGAVRSNLLALQNTADLLGETQEKLATGLKVNSALDDPTAFFTASSLNARASDLSRLQDFVGNAVQTLRAADEGIEAITNLVETAEATARQALQTAGTTSSFTGNNTASLNETDKIADLAAVFDAGDTIRITTGTGEFTQLAIDANTTITELITAVNENTAAAGSTPTDNVNGTVTVGANGGAEIRATLTTDGKIKFEGVDATAAIQIAVTNDDDTNTAGAFRTAVGLLGFDDTSGTNVEGNGGGTNASYTTANTAASATNADRASFATQFDELRTQIDQLAKDAGFNGVNLLDGDSLTVTFNEDSTSSLGIAGVTFNATGLGVTTSDNSFQTNFDITAAVTELRTAASTLRSQASTFGNNLSVVETRQDFARNIINVLETGSANLTIADTNEEGANLLALQTRQQLSSTALSLASQADQNVLRLFG